MNKLSIVPGLLVISLLFTQLVGLAPGGRADDNRQFAQKVNLALRRTVHHLLLAQGDSTSQIPPVRRINATTFFVRLDHPFAYDQLPLLLQQSLAIHKLNTPYDVAVLNCANGELLLGYNIQDLTSKSGIPCQRRDQLPGCHQLQLTFAAPETEHASTLLWWPWAIGVLLIGWGCVVWRNLKSSKPGNKATPGIATPGGENGQVICLGQLVFNAANQTVRIAGTTHALTYREAKLLHLFLRHPNQILQRDSILKSVWEDEGIIVGRSVDVFVSRLRKLLQPDPMIRLVAIHGVGYRLEYGA